MRLVPLIKRYRSLAGAGLLCLAAGACSSSSLDSNPFSKTSGLFSQPDWAVSNAKGRASTVVTAEDLISADGACAGGPPPPTPASVPESAEPNGEGTVGQAPATTAALPANDPLLQPSGGIALGMTECEVARRAGAPERVEVGTDDRGERSVVLSYARGERPGIYRFREGRLFTIERVAVAEPEKPKKPAKVTKPKTAAKPAERKAPKTAAKKPADDTAWPAPPPPQKPASAQAPWPAAPAQSNPQSQVWPSPPPLRNGQPSG